jgi:hypothetical protein
MESATIDKDDFYPIVGHEGCHKLIPSLANSLFEDYSKVDQFLYLYALLTNLIISSRHLSNRFLN